MTAVITLRIDPFIHLGPLTIAWHGVTIAIGIGLGGLLGARWLRERGLSNDPLYPLEAVLAVGDRHRPPCRRTAGRRAGGHALRRGARCRPDR